MTETSWMGARPAARPAGGPPAANLADLLERILDKGIVIVGDIKVNLLDIELLTIKLRLLVASVDRAKEMGIDWWEHDPSLSSRAPRSEATAGDSSSRELEEENRRLRERLAAVEEGDGRAIEAGKSSPRSRTTRSSGTRSSKGAKKDD